MRRILVLLVVLASCSRVEVRDQPPRQQSGLPAVRPVLPTPLSSAAQPLPVSGPVTAPVATFRVEPKLPELVKVSGPVVLEAVVDRTGAVRNVTVIQDGTEPPVGPACAQALKQWRFKPGTLNGTPVDTRFNLTVHIHVR